MVSPCGMFRLDAFYRIGGIRQTNNPEVNGVVRFHFAANPVQVAVNRRIATPGIKPDGLAFCLLLKGLPAVCRKGWRRQQQACQKRAKTHTAHNASLFERRGVTGKEPAGGQRE